MKITKKFLKMEYLKKKKQMNQIAKESNYSVPTIWRYLHKYNIKTRTQSEAQKFHTVLTKKFLIREYIRNKKSMERIAREIKSSRNNICYYLKKYNISRRSLSKSHITHGKSLRKNFCIDCGKRIKWISKRCSSCASKGKNNGMYGKFKKLHPKYIEGLDREYPLEFTDYLKSKIRKRDNYECQNCGMIEEEHLIVYGRVLEVHHIDYDKKNCKENNLITLCKQCNIRVNYNRKYWISYFQIEIGKINDKVFKR